MSFGAARGPGQSFLSLHPRCPPAVATGCNAPCVASCAASRVIIYPPPVVVTFPGPIVTTCPQQAVLGGPGGEPAPVTSLRAEIPQPEPPAGTPVPKRGPARSRRCSYVFASRWIHPCSRAGSRCSHEAQSEREENVPEKEEPGTENTDAGNEGKEASEEPRNETTPEAL